MEARKVTVILESSNSNVVIETGAETLAELKADFRAAGIDYTDKIIREGLSRTELIDDSSVLPKDVPFKGQLTNNLVFVLITVNKKIKSGYNEERTEVYNTIKSNNLKDVIYSAFGRNFTQIGTLELKNFVTDYLKPTAPAKFMVNSETSKVGCDDTHEALENRIKDIEKWCELVSDILYDEDILSTAELFKAPTEKVNSISTPSSVWDQKDLDSILDSVRQ